ncbi:MAG: cytochrome c-type biogenesis protein CcmH [Rhodospirillales bacterium]|nr:cytochrome c-type biogenesis protein CcmH [Rhodospirillales bacterium]
MRRATLRALLLAAALWGVAGPARALDSPSEMLPNPAEERRAEAIGMQLRCVVCQNESIEQSDATLARQFRGIIRRRVAEGWSDKRIIAWMVQRYGSFVLLRPPFDPATWLLWGAGPIALAAGGVAIWLARRRGAAAPAPLSAAERDRLAALLDGPGGSAGGG